MSRRPLDLEQEYFEWLCDIVGAEHKGKSYWIVLKDMYNKDFYSLVDHDENRAYDGLELREDFLSEIGYPLYWEMDKECSVLEMIIGLAKRMDFEAAKVDEDDDERIDFWFWDLVDNLGLTKYDDDNYVDEEGHIYVSWILDLFLERKYDPNGYGGLFPLDCCYENQTKVEIWYQMSAYLNEKEAV